MCRKRETAAVCITPVFRSPAGPDQTTSTMSPKAAGGFGGSSPRASSSPSEDRVYERGRVERCEVVRSLAETHELHRDAELALHRDHDAALGGPVQLRQHDARHV